MSLSLTLVEPPPGLRSLLERRHRARGRYEAISARLREGQLDDPVEVRFQLAEHSLRLADYLAAEAKIWDWSHVRENQERKAALEFEAWLREEVLP